MKLITICFVISVLYLQSANGIFFGDLFQGISKGIKDSIDAVGKISAIPFEIFKSKVDFGKAKLRDYKDEIRDRGNYGQDQQNKGQQDGDGGYNINIKTNADAESSSNNGGSSAESSGESSAYVNVDNSEDQQGKDDVLTGKDDVLTGKDDVLTGKDDVLNGQNENQQNGEQDKGGQGQGQDNNSQGQRDAGNRGQDITIDTYAGADAESSSNRGGSSARSSGDSSAYVNDKTSN